MVVVLKPFSPFEGEGQVDLSALMPPGASPAVEVLSGTLWPIPLRDCKAVLANGPLADAQGCVRVHQRVGGYADTDETLAWSFLCQSGI